MIKTLNIKNFALIDELNLDFTRGLNIITGESGSGKTLIVDALSILLGGRALSDFTREGEKKAIIEGVFALPPEHPIFELIKQNNLDVFDEELIIRREILSRGGSRNFVNDTPVQAALIKQIGASIADFHGQHEHQSLLKSEKHIEILDKTGDYENILSEYRIAREDLSKIVADLKSLKSKEQSIKEKSEYTRFQLEEIQRVSPSVNEDVELEEELKILENAEFLFSAANELYESLYGGSNSARDVLLRAESKLDELNGCDSSFSQYLSEMKSARIAVDEVAKFAKNYGDDVEINPEKTAEVRSRLLQINGLKKKFGELNVVLEKKKQFEKELEVVDNFDSEIKKYEKAIFEKQIKLGKIAKELSKRRRMAANNLEKRVVEALAGLGIINAVFWTKALRRPLGEDAPSRDFSEKVCCFIDGKAYDAFRDGIDIVEFHVSTNKGESPKPLTSVASGGEVSRIMLSIKSVVAEDEIALLVFDEIDVGVSGRIAGKTGAMMKRLSKKTQILAITHLPQIAALGDLNANVSKRESADRATIVANILDEKGKLLEIAKLLSGERITESALKSAKELCSLEKEPGLF